VSSIKGQLCITRPTSSSGEECVSIEFTDTDASVRFATFRIGLADFAKALTGLGYMPGEIEFHGLDRVGMKSENKTERIACEPPYGDKKKLATLKEKIKTLEVDGWSARNGDADNHYNYFQGGVTVVFFRHVPK